MNPIKENYSISVGSLKPVINVPLDKSELIYILTAGLGFIETKNNSFLANKTTSITDIKELSDSEYHKNGQRIINKNYLYFCKINKDYLKRESDAFDKKLFNASNLEIINFLRVQIKNTKPSLKKIETLFSSKNIIFYYNSNDYYIDVVIPCSTLRIVDFFTNKLDIIERVREVFELKTVELDVNFWLDLRKINNVKSNINAENVELNIDYEKETYLKKIQHIKDYMYCADCIPASCVYVYNLIMYRLTKTQMTKENFIKYGKLALRLDIAQNNNYCIKDFEKWCQRTCSEWYENREKTVEFLLNEIKKEDPNEIPFVITTFFREYQSIKINFKQLKCISGPEMASRFTRYLNRFCNFCLDTANVFNIYEAVQPNVYVFNNSSKSISLIRSYAYEYLMFFHTAKTFLGYQLNCTTIGDNFTKMKYKQKQLKYQNFLINKDWYADNYNGIVYKEDESGPFKFSNPIPENKNLLLFHYELLKPTKKIPNVIKNLWKDWDEIEKRAIISYYMKMYLCENNTEIAIINSSKFKYLIKFLNHINSLIELMELPVGGDYKKLSLCVYYFYLTKMTNAKIQHYITSFLNKPLFIFNDDNNKKKNIDNLSYYIDTFNINIPEIDDYLILQDERPNVLGYYYNIWKEEKDNNYPSIKKLIT